MHKPNNRSKKNLPSGGGGEIDSSNISNQTSLVSERESKTREVDEALSVFEDVRDKYGYVINDIEIATIKGNGARAMAYYVDSEGVIGVNRSYFNDKNMEAAYQRCVDQGFHPSKGDKTAIQAVVAHELGHALNDQAAKNMGTTMENAAYLIVEEARTGTKFSGTYYMAKQISGYATHNNKEAIAEAYADVYANGTKAAKESTAIVNVLNKYLKGGK